MASKVNTQKFQKYMQSLYEEFGSTATLREVGDYAADRIAKRTKLGKGVAGEGQEAFPLKPLSEGYVKARKRKRTSGTLDNTTSPKKSNLTLTGQMLRALQVLQVLPYKVIVGVKSTSRTDSDLNNSEVAGFVSKDRPFLNLSKAELNGIQSLIRKIMDRFSSKP